MRSTSAAASRPSRSLAASRPGSRSGSCTLGYTHSSTSRPVRSESRCVRTSRARWSCRPSGPARPRSNERPPKKSRRYQRVGRLRWWLGWHSRAAGNSAGTRW
jgi:hypothetical protein